MDDTEYSRCRSDEPTIDSFELEHAAPESKEKEDATFLPHREDTHAIQIRWRRKTVRVSPCALFFSAILLAVLALLGIAATVQLWLGYHKGELSIPSATKANAKFEYSSLATEHLIGSDDIPKAVLHPDRQILVSPNGLWRVRLVEDGDLVHEQRIDESQDEAQLVVRDGDNAAEGNSSATWVPVWWSNSADYKRKNQTSSVPYLDIDRDGEVHIQLQYTMVHNDTSFVRHQWSSSGHRRCNGVQRHNSTLNSQTLEPRALVVGNDGSLLTTDANSQLRCDFYGNREADIPTLHEYIDTHYTEEKPDIEGDHWPMFRNSDLATLLQIRAMLERDMARKNKTFALTRDQLETARKTAIIIPSYSGHLDFVAKFMRTLIRNCVDCELWQIDLILTKDDLHLFQERLFGADNVSYWLPGIRLLEYEALEFEHYAPELDVPAITKTLAKVGYQDFKKLYGCIATQKQYCYIMDSEATLIRTTWMSDMVKDYLDRPFVIHNPDHRNGTIDYIDCKCAAAEALSAM
ncbi:hypothetical protein ANO11243_034340 [Dothideomycetidae sp. 11243]|nr:hypothetical protein ANO11243_034340 [fungal sp. No.11243]